MFLVCSTLSQQVYCARKGPGCFEENTNSYWCVPLILTSFFRKPWARVSTDFNASDYYLWDGVKGKVYVNNIHLFKELKDSIQRKIANIWRHASPIACRETFSTYFNHSYMNKLEISVRDSSMKWAEWYGEQTTNSRRRQACCVIKLSRQRLKIRYVLISRLGTVLCGY